MLKWGSVSGGGDYAGIYIVVMTILYCVGVGSCAVMVRAVHLLQSVAHVYACVVCVCVCAFVLCVCVVCVCIMLM